MEEQSAVAVIAPPEVPQVVVHRDLRLVAENPAQLVEEQRRLIAWCDGKVADLKAHAAELQSNLDAAKAHKWKTSTLVSAVGRERARISYYEKMLAALRAGYFIVPNFDAEVFAVKTTKYEPPPRSSALTTALDWQEPRLEDMQLPPSAFGEGDYVTPSALEIRSERTELKDGKEVTHKFVRTGGFDFEIDFPFSLAKPQVMDATQAAMALRIFDDIAVLPRRARSAGDPMVVGIIRRKAGYTVKRCTFLVAWFLDTETL